MATLLDLGLLQHFSQIFAALLILILVYGVLQYTKLLGDSKAIHGFIAILIAILFLLSPSVSEVITVMTPWYVLLGIFLVFLLMVIKIFNVSDGDVRAVLSNTQEGHPEIVYTIVVIGIIIFIGSLGKVYFTGETETNINATTSGTLVGGDVGEEESVETFWAVIFHPKMLGLIFVLMISMFTVLTLARGPRVYH